MVDRTPSTDRISDERLAALITHWEPQNVMFGNQRDTLSALRELQSLRSAPEPSAEYWPAGVFDATKRSVTIKALQWTGDNLREVIAFTGRHESSKHWTWDHFEDVVRRDGLKIFTLEGSHMATVGDFIIRGVHGEFYPCKPDIFAKTYTTESAPEPGGKHDRIEAFRKRYEKFRALCLMHGNLHPSDTSAAHIALQSRAARVDGLSLLGAELLDDVFLLPSSSTTKDEKYITYDSFCCCRVLPDSEPMPDRCDHGHAFTRRSSVNGTEKHVG